MRAHARRLAAIDDALPLAPELEARCACVARVAGLPVVELRAEAVRIARRYAGMTPAQTIAGIAAELDILPAQLQADIDAITIEASACLG